MSWLDCTPKFNKKAWFGTYLAAIEENRDKRYVAAELRLLDFMDFLRRQLDVPFLLSTRVQFPTFAERVSSRVASRGIALTELLSDDLHGDAAGSSQEQSSAIIEACSSSPTPKSLYFTSITIERENQWLLVVHSSEMLPLAREFLQLALRTNLMFFYFEGMDLISDVSCDKPYEWVAKTDSEWDFNSNQRHKRLSMLLL